MGPSSHNFPASKELSMENDESAMHSSAPNQESIHRYIAICNLIYRNKKSGVRPADPIHFPLVIISTPDIKQNAVSMQANTTVTDLKLSFQRPVKIRGDADILLAMGLHKVNFRQLVKFLPDKELLKFYPQDHRRVNFQRLKSI